MDIHVVGKIRQKFGCSLKKKIQILGANSKKKANKTQRLEGKVIVRLWIFTVGINTRWSQNLLVPSDQNRTPP